MHRAIACPDKFRGSLGAAEAAEAMAAGLREAGLEAEALPLADGGEGTLEVVLAARGGARRRATVTGPLGDPVEAEWAALPDASAVVEMARASGLDLVVPGERDPLRATSRGTGELIATAARAGARRILVGVGGSASTDGGLGALDALGWSLAGLEVVVACDVRTRFVDAAVGFGPQKGATRAQVALLERRLRRLADVYRRRTALDVTGIPGGGAAGGLAGGLAALGATLAPGFETVADAVDLGERIAAADLVLTGEGSLDAGSFDGKVVGGVVELARDAGVPVGVIAGRATEEARARLEPEVPVRTLVERAWSAGEAFSRAPTLTREAAVDLVRELRG